MHLLSEISSAHKAALASEQHGTENINNTSFDPQNKHALDCFKPVGCTLMPEGYK